MLTSQARHCGARAPVTLRLLNGFEFVVDGHLLRLAPAAERLVAYLALQPGPVVRSHVAGVLWGERSEERARACLRSAIWRVNSGPGGLVVDAARSRIQLDGCVTVDVHQALDAGRRQFADASEFVDPALLTGDLLPGWYDDWVVVERERIRQVCLAAAEQMADSLLAIGDSRRAIEAASAVVAAEPLREAAHRVLICAYVCAGNRAEALRQFERCRVLLRDELGLQPGDDLAAAAATARETRPHAS